MITLFIVICLDSLLRRRSHDFLAMGVDAWQTHTNVYVGGRLTWYIKHVFRVRDMNKNSLS